MDDDEYVTPGWLDCLIATQSSYSASVVTGPVITDFPPNVAGWIRRGGFIERSRQATGPCVGIPATNNTLVLTSALSKMQRPRFDTSFSVTGGSDTEFFTRMMEMGLIPIWCDDAVVHEDAPTDRLTLKWVSKRMVRAGNVSGRIALTRRGRVRVVIGGLNRILVGVIRLTVSAVTLRGFRAVDYGYVCRGIGWIGAATGNLVREYRRPGHLQ